MYRIQTFENERVTRTLYETDEAKAHRAFLDAVDAAKAGVMNRLVFMGAVVRLDMCANQHFQSDVSPMISAVVRRVGNDKADARFTKHCYVADPAPKADNGVIVGYIEPITKAPATTPKPFRMDVKHYLLHHESQRRFETEEALQNELDALAHVVQADHYEVRMSVTITEENGRVRHLELYRGDDGGVVQIDREIVGNVAI